MEGILLLDKDQGPSSHNAVTETRMILGGVKAGHTGTLDPLASGLLVVLLGRSTKLAPFVPGDPKVYEGSIMLGISTDSMDTEGELLSTATFQGGPDEVERALASLVGKLEQIPPMHSAVKFHGTPLYRYARRGEEVPRKSRTVSVYSFDMTAIRVEGDHAVFDFGIACSPGTYVRELASRVGDILGCGGALSRLRRTRSGPLAVDEAVTLAGLRACLDAGVSPVLPEERALAGYRRVYVGGDGVDTVSNGAVLIESMVEMADEGLHVGDLVAVMGQGKLLGMHRVTQVSPYLSNAVRIM